MSLLTNTDIFIEDDDLLRELDAMVEELNNDYLMICYNSIKLTDKLNKVEQLLDTKIISPELAIYLYHIARANQYHLDILKYGHNNLDVSWSFKEVYTSVLEVLNHQIDKLCYLDSLKGGNLLNIRMINYEELTPVKFRYTNDMIDISHPMFKDILNDDNINKSIENYKEIYEELFY